MTATITQPAAADTTDAFPIHGTDYIEFWVGNAKQSMLYYCYAFGFELDRLPRPRDRRPRPCLVPA
ncbi:MAG: hypothetical protein V9E87_16590 [Gemmatimonadales bacterium]